MNDTSKLNGAEKPSVVVETAQENRNTKKPPSKAKAKDVKRQQSLGTWFREIRAEAGKIIWPNRKELTKMTVTVVVTSLLFGALIAGMDTAFRFVTGILVDLL